MQRLKFLYKNRNKDLLFSNEDKIYNNKDNLPKTRMGQSNVLIKKPDILELIKVLNLFKKAIDEDYIFYDIRTRKIILRRHSFFNLLKTRIRKGRVIYTACLNNTPVGVVIGHSTIEGVGIVSWLYVDPKYRSRGFAQKLLKSVESELEKYGCHKISVSTETARDFYFKMGYSMEGVFKKHSWKNDFYFFGKTLGE